MIKIIYAILLGVILAFFVGLGVEAFYPTEQYPQQPSELQYVKGDLTADQQKIQSDYDQQVKDYNTRNEKHARNTSAIVIVFSIILMIISLSVLHSKEEFSNGFLIGSLLTLMYGIIRGFESNDSKFRFIIVTIGLIFALILGYFKFIKNKDGAEGSK